MYKMENTKLKNIVMTFLQRKVGTNIHINEMKTEEGSNKVLVVIGVSLPRMTYDDANQKQYLRFIKFDNLFSFEASIDRSGQINAKVDPKIFFERVFKKEDRLKSEVESIILDKIYPNLVDIPLIRTFLRPIYTILSEIFYRGEFSKIKIDSYPNKERLLRYLSFLKDFDIIRKNSDGNYVKGNIPIELISALKNKDESEVLRHVFGYVIRDGRKYIKEELKLSMVEAFLKVITSYYLSALNVERVIQIDEQTFYDELHEQYPEYKIHESKFLSHLNDLTSANILKKDKNFFSGDLNLLIDIQKAINKINPSSIVA